MNDILNFGCGKKILPFWTNVDIQKGEGIYKSFDFNKYPYPLKDNSFGFVLVDNVLEHLDDPKKVLDELYRICYNGARIHIAVPYYNCKGAYNDITHKHYFNENAFDVLLKPHKHHAITEEKKFRIHCIRLIPTRLGRLFPAKIRKVLSGIIGEIYGSIEVELVVIK